MDRFLSLKVQDFNSSNVSSSSMISNFGYQTAICDESSMYYSINNSNNDSMQDKTLAADIEMENKENLQQIQLSSELRILTSTPNIEFISNESISISELNDTHGASSTISMDCLIDKKSMIDHCKDDTQGAISTISVDCFNDNKSTIDCTDNLTSGVSFADSLPQSFILKEAKHCENSSQAVISKVLINILLTILNIFPAFFI